MCVFGDGEGNQLNMEDTISFSFPVCKAGEQLYLLQRVVLKEAEMRWPCS